MLCCNELTTPLNKASMVVPVGENGSWFISSKFFVHDARMKAVLISIMIFFFIKLYFFDAGHGSFDKLRNPKAVELRNPKVVKLRTPKVVELRNPKAVELRNPKVVEPVETPQSRVTLLFI